MFITTILGVFGLGLLVLFLCLVGLAVQALKTYIRRNGR